ncbi:MAG: thioredoxin:protein disulfide reductase [Verrucomicrobiota bacterium]|jgi:thiol:disulfide interchange protein|nr:thioredoxin:protein disulfide reductase [Verrucomicrobiota bacterium]MDK2963570.1 thioredoxin:protein disulfide reductase [Verrucomicrobiota bacterium]
MNIWRSILLAAALTAPLAPAQIRQPYTWSYVSGKDTLTVEVTIPEGNYLYADRTSINIPDAGALLSEPVPQLHTDDFGTSEIYEGGQVHRWIYAADPEKSYRITVHYQGCGTPDGSGAVCYPPADETFITGTTVTAPDISPMENPADGNSLDALLDRFKTVRVDGGIKNVDEMLAFLDTERAVSSSAGFLAGKSGLFTILLVLFGGLALNLTPCVLPMIPVNLAIIGAGSAASGKRHGFIRGGVYGTGIALAYGGLGIFTVLTGSKFGTLNASPVFNFIIAGVFVILALALFDVLNIDLSRFSPRTGIPNGRKGQLIPVLLMGIAAALLAGACVAPIVIAVLLHAATLYAGGNVAGLFLPLLLGIGMALPWPVAGAGLAILPKPGAWMIKIKHGFGVLIVLFAFYYAHLGVKLLPTAATDPGNVITELENQLSQALTAGKPVFIDFWASWCKNCLQMEATTFKDPKVIDRLRDFQKIKFQAENPANPEIKKIMDRYGLPGLPGYVILKPELKE